jgi:hypothetical protein
LEKGSRNTPASSRVLTAEENCRRGGLRLCCDAVADIDPGAAASAIVSILELAQARGGFAKKAAAELKRQARTKPKS